MRLLRPPSLLAILVIACGGESRRARSDSSEGGSGSGSGGDASGGTSAGGASVGGTASVTGGAAGSAGASDCSNLPAWGTNRLCVPNCATDPNAYVSPDCVGGAYVCPDATMTIGSCPAETCARRNDFECCRLASGTVERVRCSADGGGTLPCEPGSERREVGTSCIPEGIDVARCAELEGVPCSNEAIECHEGTGCSAMTCFCLPVGDGGAQTWTCQVILC